MGRKITAAFLGCVVILYVITVGFVGTQDGRMIDFEHYAENVTYHAQNFVDLRTVIVEIWTKDVVTYPTLRYDLNMDGRIGTGDFIQASRTYRVGLYSGTNEILEFFDGINEFFQRAILTVRHLIYGLMSCWDFVGAILPWNYLTETEWRPIWER